MQGPENVPDLVQHARHRSSRSQTCRMASPLQRAGKVEPIIAMDAMISVVGSVWNRNRRSRSPHQQLHAWSFASYML